MEKYISVNKSGCSIRAKLFYNNIRSIDEVILCCHGFAGSKDSYSIGKLAEKVLPSYKNVAVLSFDAPCHGDDKRPKLTLDICALYIKTMIEYINDDMKCNVIDAHGVSFGGYLILKYVFENGNPFNKIVLRSPAVDMSESFSRILTPSDFEKLAKDKKLEVGFEKKVPINMDFVKGLEANNVSMYDFKKYNNDMIIVHGTNDEMVPYIRVKEFAEKNGIMLFTHENTDHRFQSPEQMGLAVKEITEFLFA